MEAVARIADKVSPIPIEAESPSEWNLEKRMN
jgi:hypothetical protein